MRKPDFCLYENKDADQLRSNCEADQRLCFRYSNSTIPFQSEFSSFKLFSVAVQTRAGRKPQRPVFLNCGSISSVRIEHRVSATKEQFGHHENLPVQYLESF